MRDPGDADTERPFSQLERYAGWLARDHVSVAVRADVQALGAAMNVGHDTSLELLKLDQDINRMPSGDIVIPAALRRPPAVEKR